MKFYLNKPIISEKEKLSWEKGDKLPRINLSQYEIIDGTIDDIEKHIIEFVKKSFTDIKEAMTINEFEEVSIIMPALQMCSVDEIDIIDVNIKIENIEYNEVQWFLKELSSSLTGELVQEFESESERIIEPIEEVESDEYVESDDEYIEEEVINEETENPTADEISEMEMDIIRKSLLDGEDKTM
jgi:hypothetical protein